MIALSPANHNDYLRTPKALKTSLNTERQRERQRETERKRQTDRDREGETDRQREGERKERGKREKGESSLRGDKTEKDVGITVELSHNLLSAASSD